MKNILLICFLGFLYVSCEDIIQEDLDGFGVILLTPPENHTTSLNVTQFKWEPVPYADAYRIQIVEPSFNGPVQFLVDSVALGITWTQSLSPGDYEWRVRAENNISHTAYFERRLTVLSTNDLTGQLPQLIAPLDLFNTNANSLTFSWNILPGAVDHRFQITDLTNDLDLDLINNIVPTDTFQWNNFIEGDYRWGVQAQNPNASSEFSFREFTVDRTPPSQPLLLSPSDGTISSEEEISFEWTSGVDAWTSVNDTLYLLNLLSMEQQAIPVLGGVYMDSLEIGTYEWEIRSFDELGHFSESNPFSLTLQ